MNAKLRRILEESKVGAHIIVLVDWREKAPYTFEGLRTPESNSFVIAEKDHLAAGDYSLFGCESCVAVERKSAIDLYRTIAGRRRQFLAELQYLECNIKNPFVVVESTWIDLMVRPPANATIPPIAVDNFVTECCKRFPTVNWRFEDGRRKGEMQTLRLLEAFLPQQPQSRE